MACKSLTVHLNQDFLLDSLFEKSARKMFYGKNGAQEEKSQWKNIIDVTKRHFQNEKNNTLLN